MDRIAAAEYPVMDWIRRRWSPHAFAARPVERDKLLSLFEAARWSSSCYNDQPWNLRQREASPRVRRPVREFVFDGRWGKPMAGL